MEKGHLMNREVVEKWVAALRSMEYRQARKRLRIEDRYCGLGVLCELHRREFGGEWVPAETTADGETAYLYRGGRFQPPPAVLEWVDENVGRKTIVIDGAPYTLAELNDLLHMNFNDIADLIERRWLRRRSKA